MAETYPLFVKSFHEKEILSKSDAGSKVRITSKFFSFLPLTWEGEGVKTRNERIDWVQTTGLLEGLTANWLFSSAEPMKTKVTIVGRYSGSGLKGTMLTLIAPLLVKKAVSKILTSIKLP